MVMASFNHVRGLDFHYGSQLWPTTAPVVIRVSGKWVSGQKLVLSLSLSPLVGLSVVLKEKQKWGEKNKRHTHSKQGDNINYSHHKSKVAQHSLKKNVTSSNPVSTYKGTAHSHRRRHGDKRTPASNENISVRFLMGFRKFMLRLNKYLCSVCCFC